MVVMTAEFEVKTESLERVITAIQTFIQQIEKNEPDTKIYFSIQDDEKPSRFLHYFEFKDQVAEEKHRNTPWVKEFTNVIYPETINGVSFSRYKKIASTK